MRAALFWGFLWVMSLGCGEHDPPLTDVGTDTSLRDGGRDSDHPDLGETDLDCDQDHDGHRSIACGGDDCDDGDAFRFPTNPERCDGVLPDGRSASDHDEDCNPCTLAGIGVDGNHDTDLYISAECSNGWPGDTAPIGCDPNATVVNDSARIVEGADCDDTDGDVHPNQPEICGDEIDNNCNGELDSGFLYPDLDNDGRGDRDRGEMRACTTGWVFNDEDCDDRTPWTYEGAREICDNRDNDCSLPGELAGGEELEDLDGDGAASETATCAGRGDEGVLSFWGALPRTDCDDSTMAIGPMVVEICGNHIDEDCNGVEDDDMQTWCRDVDEDGFGDPTDSVTIIDCMPVDGYVPNCTDCDDGAANRFPGNAEICDGVDNDCTEAGPVLLAEDQDGDGHALRDAACIAAGETGSSAGAFPRDDCDDRDGGAHPLANEYCDGVDSNCSSGGGIAAEEDGDGDHYSPVDAACIGAGEPGAGVAVFPKTDCDDGESAANPGFSAAQDRRMCDGIDNDCDPSTNERTSLCVNGAGYCGPGGECGRGPKAIDVAAGAQHVCALLQDGTVSCWGANAAGQLGDGTNDAHHEPSQVIGVDSATTISAGGSGSCAVLADGTVMCWGSVAYDGSLSTPQARLSDAVDVQLGGHACALKRDGHVVCWGNGDSGQLGDGRNFGSNTPETVLGLSDAVAIAVGQHHSCALRAGGQVLCWGDNARGQLGIGSRLGANTPMDTGLTGIAGLSSSNDHTCAHHNDGRVFCWGENYVGMLGTGTTILSDTPVLSDIVGVSQIAVGHTHTCALVTGEVRCWGGNPSGQLGNGSTIEGHRPTSVLGLDGIIHITSGITVSCALNSDGKVWCWGGNEAGELGTLPPTVALSPVLVEGLGGAVEIAGGDRQTCARTRTGRVMCWGGNTHGQLGDGTTTPALSPITIGVAEPATGLSAGINTTCVTVAGRAQCWGGNSAGQIGDGTTVDRSSPTFAESITAITDLSTSGILTCAVHGPSGFVSCWGLRAGITPMLASIEGVTQVATRRLDPCVLLTDGNVQCWRVGLSGPETVTGLSNVTAITAGAHYTCALRTNGTVGCWGDNTEGALGDGTTTVRTGVVMVTGLSHVAEIAGSPDDPVVGPHTCARHTDGTVSCWGNNTFGQLGDGTQVERLTPITVSGITSAVAIGVGSAHSCAILEDDSIHCWGRNASGQLGDGSVVDRLVPTLVLDI